MAAAMYSGLASTGVDLTNPAWLFGVAPLLSTLISNLMSNVPAVMSAASRTSSSSRRRGGRAGLVTLSSGAYEFVRAVSEKAIGSAGSVAVTDLLVRSADPLPMILIVDDEAGIREAVRRFLVRRGFQVSTAADPTEALQILQQARPTAMILDIRMPDPTGRMRSGLDLLRFVRGQLEFATLRVIVLTGHMLTADEQATLRACRADVLYKPLELHRLSEHLSTSASASAGTLSSCD